MGSEKYSENNDQNGITSKLFCNENGKFCFELKMTHGRYNSYLQIFDRKPGDGDFMTFRRKKAKTVDQ